MDPEEQTWKEPRSSSVTTSSDIYEPSANLFCGFFPMLLGTQCPQSCKMCAWNALKMHIFFKFNSFHIHRTLGYLVHLNKMRLHLKIYSFFSPQGILFVCLSVYLLGGSSLQGGKLLTRGVISDGYWIFATESGLITAVNSPWHDLALQPLKQERLTMFTPNGIMGFNSPFISQRSHGVHALRWVRWRSHCCLETKIKDSEDSNPDSHIQLQSNRAHSVFWFHWFCFF